MIAYGDGMSFSFDNNFILIDKLLEKVSFKSCDSSYDLEIVYCCFDLGDFFYPSGYGFVIPGRKKGNLD
jgi:hypothetical protein